MVCKFDLSRTVYGHESVGRRRRAFLGKATRWLAEISNSDQFCKLLRKER